MSHDTYRPRIGMVSLLVYRECRCGEWCATGEGAKPPGCPECGSPMWPLGTATTSDGDPRFGADKREQRRLRGLGFVGYFTNEIAASELLGRVYGLLGVRQASLGHHGRGLWAGGSPYAADGEVSRDLGDEVKA